MMRPGRRVREVYAVLRFACYGTLQPTELYDAAADLGL